LSKIMAGGGAAVGGGGVQSTPTAMTYISIAVCMMGAAMFGADQNNYGVTYGFTSFQEHWCPGFDFTEKELQGVNCSKIGSLKHQPAAWQSFITWGLQLVTLGMCAGAFTLGPLLSNLIGRRYTISISGAICFIGCALVAWIADKNIVLYYIGRFITGFGCGMACMVLPMYNAEVATLNIRGLTGSLFQFMVVIGGVVAVVICGFMESWGQGFMIPGYFGLAVAIGALFCPESPRFLLDRKGAEAARPHLQRVRQGDVSEELAFLETALREERTAGKVGWGELFCKPGLRKRLFVACYLQAAQQLTGVNAFLGFQSDIYQAAGYSEESVNNIPGGPAFIVQMVFIVGSLFGLFVVDSSFGGRKTQLMGASFLMGPALLIAAITHFVNGAPSITGYMVYVFAFGFQAAWGIIPWFYPAEIFQMKERERALAVSTLFGFAVNFLVGMVTKALFSWSQGGMFLIYGILNVTNCIFVVVFIKETKGVQLEKIPGMFGPVDGENAKLDGLEYNENGNDRTAALKV